ncbi:flagellar export chaperone FliS [Nocardioides sp.]|uniref:flagellar export chaperone FliS n=1 Tax=Nocardioides sp. TaxID=35761 RepID=UPI00273507CC|nr:flagellar export chaperone FliS [Nocardioides sp.]MDP3894541.1 flagellar export chaperone FliS [Nocardioides sp.]
MIANARATYMQASVSTASPARLLVMLYERLELDVRRAHEALLASEPLTAHEQLVHAQEIVSELQASLRPDLWSGGPSMASLYDYLLRRLVEANLRKDAAIAAECLELVTDLCETWRAAALQSAAASG